MAQLNELPLSIQKHYPDPSLVAQCLASETEQGTTYTVQLTNGRNDTWKRKSFWWQLDRQEFSKARRR